jgi:hypothetical protein
MEPIEDYLFGYNNLGEIVNTGRFKLPDNFIRVLQKMHPEINGIEIKSINTASLVSAKYFEVTENFRVNIVIQIARKKHPVGCLGDYDEKITTLFRYTYDDYQFVSFRVVEMIYEPDISNRDKFMELFVNKGE